MTDTPGQAAPGWYPDPSGAPRQRYFDGEIWTEHYHDDATAAAGSPLGAAGGGMAAMGAAGPALNPIGYWKKVVLENYANFSGRARRAEYWWAYLINIAIAIVLFIIGAAVIGEGGVFLPLIFFLGVFIPMLASMVRRLHDTGKSGWYYFVSLIPFVGGIILLVFLATDGEKGPNQYGPSPKY